MQAALLAMSVALLGSAASAQPACVGYAGPGGPCYAGPGGPAYGGPSVPPRRNTPSIRDWQPPDTMERMRRAYELGERTREVQAQSEAEMVRRQVGAFVARGDCSGALAIALEAGGLELAEQVSRICTPAR